MGWSVKYATSSVVAVICDLDWWSYTPHAPCIVIALIYPRYPSADRIDSSAN
jgi:hypothetical protein